MTLDVQRVSGPSENEFGSLSNCLVGGDPQSEKRARRIKHRAVAISIALQSLALVALILFPLLSKGERISLKYSTPIPPYAPIGDHRVVSHEGARAPDTSHFFATIFRPTTGRVTGRPRTERGGSEGDVFVGLVPTTGVEGGIVPTTSRPAAPREDNTPANKDRVRVSEMQQMAQLITRVDPIYPPLAVQIHREGRVELRAIISAGGAIESLEVISGDPFFIQSALSAVRQWRYHPTILNGRPIEVDTRITVIYTLSR